MADEVIPVADAIVAVRQAVVPYKSQYAVGTQYKTDVRLRAAITYLEAHEHVMAERDAARAELADLQHQVVRLSSYPSRADIMQVEAYKGQLRAEQELAEARAEIERLTKRQAELIANNEKAFEQNANQQREIKRLCAPPPEDAMEAAQKILPVGFMAEAIQLLLPTRLGDIENKLRDDIARALTAAREAGFKDAITTTQSGWHSLNTALKMIRDAITELSGAMPSIRERDVGPPDYEADANEIIDGFQRALVAAREAEREKYRAVVDTLRAIADSPSVPPHLQLIARNAIAAFEGLHT